MTMNERRDTSTPIDRRRYWRIVRFFGAIILHLAVVDIVLGRLWFVGSAIRRSRPRRFRQMSRDFRLLAVEMGGVLIKLGQFLSARVDVLPPEITEELQGLQDEVPPVDPYLLRRVLERELGDKLDDFAEIEMEPLAAASLGQTVRAWLKPVPEPVAVIREAIPEPVAVAVGGPTAVSAPPSNGYHNGHHVPETVEILGEMHGRGKPLVLKVQRPNIDQIVDTDLEALRAVAPWVMRYEPIRRRADIPALLEEFAITLWEELDYESEVHNAQRFKKIFAHEPRIYIPEVYEEYCTKRVVALENVENPKINEIEAIEEAGINKQNVANLLIEAYLTMLFREGFFHADPHPGNIFIRPLGEPLTETERKQGRSRPYQVIFIDFGMVGHLSPELKKNLTEVLLGLVQNDARRVVDAYRNMGFFLPGTDYERIVQAQASLMERLEGRNLRELAQPDPEEVRQIGEEFRDILYDFPFQVPHDFIYLGRALGLLSGIASSLYPEVNPWYLIEKYGLQILQTEQNQFDFSRESLTALAQQLRPFLNLPTQLQRVVQAAETGRLQVQSRDLQAERRLEKVEKKVGQLSVSILAAAGLISGTLLYLNRQNKKGEE